MSGPSTRNSLASTESTLRTSVASDADRAPREWGSKTLILQNAYTEFCQLREDGIGVTASEFADRFPTYRRSLRKLLEVDEYFGQFPSFDSDDWPQVGDEFSGFEIIDILGSGASARVYLAKELSLGHRLVAIKVAYEGAAEAETLGKLSHANVVPVHSVQMDDASCLTAVCMPYLGSSTLADVLDEIHGGDEPALRGSQVLEALEKREHVRGFCDRCREESPPNHILVDGPYVDAVVRIGIQLAEALNYTSERGILHRDLKPANILVTPDGRPMLLDFCLSMENTESTTARQGGTLPYMAPEQIQEAFLETGRKSRFDPRSDLFALGVILYECLSGRLPFGEPEMGSDIKGTAQKFVTAQRAPIKPLNEWNPEVSRALADSVHGCLTYEMDDRTESPAELALQLRQRFTRGARLKRWVWRHRIGVAVLCLVSALCAAVAGGFYATRPSLAERLYSQALEALRSDDPQAAVGHLDRVLSSEPESMVARFARGRAHLLLSDHASAISDFRAAADEHSDSAMYEWLAYVYSLRGEDDLASHFYGAAAETAKDINDEARLRLNRAVLFDRAGEIANAWREITDAVTLRPEFAAPYFFRARLLFRRAYDGRTSIQQAVDDIECALEFGASNQARHFDAAHIYSRAADEFPNEQKYAEKVEVNLTAAAKVGLPSVAFRSPWTAAWADQQWFQELPRAETHTPMSHPHFFSSPCFSPPNQL